MYLLALYLRTEKRSVLDVEVACRADELFSDARLHMRNDHSEADLNASRNSTNRLRHPTYTIARGFSDRWQITYGIVVAIVGRGSH